MRQTTLSVPLEVKPESCSKLSSIIEMVKQREDTGAGGFPENFSRVTKMIPALHFMSMSVFPANDYDPLFILEANFDGAEGPFWAQVESLFGADLREMLRCCKRPMDQDGTLYDAVTAAGSRAPVAPYLEARTQRPSVFHHGNRGLSRDRILDGQALFVAVRAELDAPLADAAGPGYHAMAPGAMHGALRAAMLPHFKWLGEAAPPRITTAERAMDFLRLAVFAIVALLVLSAPGLVLAALLPARTYLLLVLLTGIVLILLIARGRHTLTGREIPTNFKLSSAILGRFVLLVVLIVVYAIFATLLLDPVVAAATVLLHILQGEPLAGVWHEHVRQIWPEARVVLLGLVSLAISLPLLILVLRYDEQHGSTHDAPHLSERTYRDMIRREDWVAQNHMGSIVLIKPGILRSIIIHAGHRGLGLFLRWSATDGYLGSMRTVHFAHWAFLNNGSRLLFFSNFDHSWGSYLDDFIEKAHAGLTLAWGCGVGFPQTRFLVYDGASHGRQFKTWALASRAVSRFWYSAYRDLTVDQIERNERIVAGLRQTRLNNDEAVKWARDL